MDPKFGTRHNTLYGITDVANMLVTMASHRGYANSAHEHKMLKTKILAANGYSICSDP